MNVVREVSPQEGHSMNAVTILLMILAVEIPLAWAYVNRRGRT